ncbi:tetratricopeptide repeat protein [Shewanella woodyi]|uniref:tetratricopeptide repeat protein n=1 Tax=Shewanella woodyi TaxID=60961 RepID=UPI003748D9D5
MKKFIYSILLAALTQFSTQTFASTSLEPCNTAECQEYFKAYKILTKRGHSEAMATLGELYYTGYGTDKDIKQALKWFRRAAKFGIVTAQYKAGVMYLQETDYKDVDKGIGYLKKASKIEFSPASFILGKVYLGDTFGVKNNKKADYWLSHAYELNNYQAKNFARKLFVSKSRDTFQMPRLYSLIANDISTSQFNADDLNSPKGEMEVITVSAPDYQAYFDAEIARLNNIEPDTKSGTGSNIAGNSCAKLWGCSTEGSSDRVRDVLLSDWGRESGQFRIDGGNW